MSQISAASVNELRKKTDQPLMDCKKALTEAGGDMEKAIELLRSWNAKAGVKREGNEAAEGRVGVFIDPAAQVAAILEMRCESAPTAKNDRYVALVNDLVKQVATGNPADIAALVAQPMADAGTVQDRINDTVGLIREKMVPHRFARLTGGVFGQYIHHDGTVGALIQCEGKEGQDELLRDVCAHVSALNPQYMAVDQVPSAAIEKEKAFIMQQIKDDPKNASKPENIIEKIADGRIKSWLAEIVLTEQPMANAAKYPGKTVGQALHAVGLKPKAVVRYKVGAIAS